MFKRQSNIVTPMDKYRDKARDMMEYVPPLDDRKRMIEELNEECYADLGEFLASDVLQELGNWLLHEYHADRTNNKAAKSEYPVLSKYQIKRRKRQVVLMDCERSLSTLAYHIKNNSTFRNKRSGDSWEGCGHDE